MSAHYLRLSASYARKLHNIQLIVTASGEFIYPDTFQIELQLTLKFSHVGTEWRR